MSSDKSLCQGVGMPEEVKQKECSSAMRYRNGPGKRDGSFDQSSGGRLQRWGEAGDTWEVKLHRLVIE